MIKHFRISGSTDETGKCSIQFTIPGTFSGLMSSSSTWSGRIIKSVEAVFASGALGDYVTNIVVSDPNGVIPVPYRAAFPSYPFLGTRTDVQSPEENRGFFLFPGMVNRIVSDPALSVASELVVTADFYAVEARSDTVWVNILWDDLT